MEQMLNIITIPMEYEINIEHARLERTGKSGPPILEIEREHGGWTMENRPAKLILDTYDARNSVVPTTKTAIYQNAQRGIQAAGTAAQNYASEAAQMVWSKPGQGGQTLSRIFAQRVQLPTGEFKLGFLPTTGVDITYQAGVQKKKRPVAFSVSNTKQRQVFPHGYFNRNQAEFGEITI